MLVLGDIKDKMDDIALREHIIAEFETPVDALDRFTILIAYMAQYSYEGSAWFLLRDNNSGHLYEAHGSHCSCYGFENQWKPEKTTLKYLKSDNFSFYAGYGDDENDAKARVKAFIETLQW